MGVKTETVMTKDFSMDYFKFGKGENIMVILPGLMDSFGKEIYPSNVYEMYKDTFKAMAQTVKDEELERFIILAEGIRGFNVVDRLSSIKCPVMVLGEFEDSVLDSDASMEIAEKLDEIGSLKLYL